ncbi:DUF6489 family protein [Halomonas sp.]|jgi:hypothetical protein|uniref:DUF6489 family protein n=1 Tax=Halomonas sp. TaxID=1486246 RepID=UPI0035689AE3
MKINVEFDLTPDEFRRSLGLPDVEVFQQDLLSRIHKQMESGVEGYDPMSLMQPFLQQQPGVPQGLSQELTQGLSQGLSSFGTYQQMMLDMLNQATSKGQGKEGTESKESKESKESQASTGGRERKNSEATKPTGADTSTAQSGTGKPASSQSTTKSTGSARSRGKREDA